MVAAYGDDHAHDDGKPGFLRAGSIQLTTKILVHFI